VKRQKYEQLQTKRATSFFRAFIAKLIAGKFKILYWGWWPISAREYGLSLYWKDNSEEE